MIKIKRGVEVINRYDIEDLYIEHVFTFDELEKIVDEEYVLMSEEEKQMRAREVDPTFYEYLLSVFGMNRDQYISVTITGYTDYEFNEVTI